MYDVYQVTSPLVKDTVYYTEYVADIQSVQNVELRARVKGFVEKIFVDEGQMVKAGQLLFSISRQEHEQERLKAQAAHASAVADAKVAEVDLSNVKTLVDKDVISKSEYDVALAKLEALKAKVEEAKAHEASSGLLLSFTEVRAPFSGVINRIPNKRGSLVDEGALLTSLSDNSEVFAYFNVSENDYLDIAGRGLYSKVNEVTLVLANQKVHPHKGVIETVEGEVDRATGNIAFRARFPNPGLLLKHGSTGKVILNHKLKGALIIPLKSTFEIQDIVYVYAIDASNHVQLRMVKPRLRISQLLVLEGGLTTNDKILYEGIQRVKEGDLITPEFVDMKVILPTLGEF